MDARAPGLRLGPYELIAQIGSGGMGEVWKAYDRRIDRVVAIKFVHAQFSERFQREVHAIAALNHPNICHLYDLGADYLVMEYVEGMPLKGPLPIEQALRYASQICEALDAAHRKGIVHRDLIWCRLMEISDEHSSGPKHSSRCQRRRATRRHNNECIFGYFNLHQCQSSWDDDVHSQQRRTKASIRASIALH